MRRFQADDAPAVARLNVRLERGGVEHRVYPEHWQHQFDPNAPLSERLFVVVDGSEVRGGVWLREQDFWVGGQVVRAGWAKYPVSESLIDHRFGGVAGSLIVRLLREQPNLMALGLGGCDTPFARLLTGFHWVGQRVPFLFFVARPRAVLRRLAFLRRHAAMRWLLDGVASSGLGWLAARAAQAPAAVRCRRLVSELWVEEEEEFGPWADAIWRRCRGAYGFLAVRDGFALRAVYDRSKLRNAIVRLRVARGGEDIGWACVRCSTFRDKPDPHFGTLTVGLIADGVALPSDAAAVVAAAQRHLLDAGVDLVVSNQLHPSWTGALQRLGFFPGPSNFALYSAPAIERLLSDAGVGGVHVNRGDCDGPVWS